MILRPAGLLRRDDRLLLMRYHYEGQPRWNLPGGKPESGESLIDCLVREFQEELGLDIAPGPLRLVVETAAGGREVLHLLFEVNATGEPCLNPTHTSAESLAWVAWGQLSALSLYPAVEKILHEALATGPIYRGRIAQSWS